MLNGKKREAWIDNLKFIACIAVFWGHFYSAFYGQLLDTSFLAKADSVCIFIIKHVLNILFNGDWWVYVFCIISGWLAWKKDVKTVKELTKAIAHRYIRFVVPVFAANILVIIIDRTIGFYSADVGVAINNNWLASNYCNRPSIAHVFTSALCLSNEYIGPIWVLKYIFWGTCVVYGIKYIATKFNVNNRNGHCDVCVVATDILYVNQV